MATLNLKVVLSERLASPDATTYHPRALERLELPKVLARLERLCACSLGADLVRQLVPTNDNRVAREWLALTSEAARFIQLVRMPAFGDLSDVRSQLKSASIGAILDAEPLLHVGRAAQGVRRLREALIDVPDELEGEFPRLEDLADGLFPRLDVEKAIFDAIDDNAEIKDNASVDLLKARRGIRQAQSQIQTRLRGMLSDSSVQGHLQDAFVTMRDGRYCLPVKAESRGSVPGIVHDRSKSGNAVFIEPQAVVELNNRLRELAADEQAAMLAILKELSARVGDAGDELSRSLGAAGELDFAFAKARLSAEMDAREPLLRDDVRGFGLENARHPLVEGCVPNTIQLGEESAVTERGDFDVMMLTGPNTGGKTVVLKTLGLLTAMVGCGLHLPVGEKSWLHLPGQIHVDIGDEQSIEQSLSTFSGHLKNIVGILKTVQPFDLVLFDEIGAGTDPDEGAALAKAVLRSLSRRGAHVVATTHYGELKQFALSAQRFENASVEFDPQTLQPTYHLRIGVPGASNALDIAARLGMPPELVGRARKYLGTDRMENEAATQRLEETQRELSGQIEGARQEREEVERLRRDYERRLGKIEAARDKEIEKAKREAREIVDKAQREADEALRELRRATRATGGRGENRETEEARGRLRTLRERVAVSTFDSTANGKAKRREDGKNKEDSRPNSARTSANLPVSPPSRLPVEIAPGDIVTVKSLSREGEVLRVEGNRVELRVGAMKIEAKLADLVPSKAGPVAGVGTAISTRKSWNIGEEINLVGQNTAEAIPQLEKYLDDAILAGLPEVRVVHGRGSGALRRAVHEFLRGFGSRLSFETAAQNQGGEGATVIRLS